MAKAEFKPQDALLPVFLVLVISYVIFSGKILYDCKVKNNYWNMHENETSMKLMEYSEQKQEQQNKADIYVAYEESSSCSRYQYRAEATDYLEKYIVEEGDTAQSIVNDVVKNPSRVGELLKLNSKRYPGLSLQNSYLEIGWELLLPPAEVDESSGDLRLISGRLVDETKGSTQGWKINVGGSKPSMVNVYPKNPKAFIEEGIAFGDCIDILQEFYGSKTLVVTRQ